MRITFKFLQNHPIIKAVGTKISKKKNLHNCQYFDISERKYGGIIFYILNI